jgi:hypothetical protein
LGAFGEEPTKLKTLKYDRSTRSIRTHKAIKIKGQIRMYCRMGDIFEMEGTVMSQRLSKMLSRSKLEMNKKIHQTSNGWDMLSNIGISYHVCYIL